MGINILFFCIIGAMRVIQKICSKKASNFIDSSDKFFHYGAYYQTMSAVCALILLCFVGFYGFDLTTLLCALITAILFALDLYSGIEAIKGATLGICNMVAMGGLFVPCIVGIFLFNEPMSVWQWVGLAIFIGSIYFLASDSKSTYNKFTVKTLLMLILSFFVNGAIMVVQKYFAILVPNGNVAAYSFLTFGFNAAIMMICFSILLLKKRPVEGEKRFEMLPKKLYFCGALLAVALFTVNQLVTTMAETVPSVILFTVSSAISVIITCIVSATVFKEKITWKNIVGLVLGIGSIVIVNVL